MPGKPSNPSRTATRRAIFGRCSSYGSPQPKVQVGDLGWIELPPLIERGSDYRGGDIVGAKFGERAVDGPSDRRPNGGNDHGFQASGIVSQDGRKMTFPSASAAPGAIVFAQMSSPS
jgi:hypothetical protein